MNLWPVEHFNNNNHTQKWRQICWKSVQLVRGSFFRNDLLQNPYFSATYYLLRDYASITSSCFWLFKAHPSTSFLTLPIHLIDDVILEWSLNANFRVHHTFIGNLEFLVAFYCFTILQSNIWYIKGPPYEKAIGCLRVSSYFTKVMWGDLELQFSLPGL